MTIEHRVLGAPGRDNALLVRVDSGQSIDCLLFDCGEGCLSDLSFGEIQSIDHLFFSHLHMDHIGGFDSFFRCNYARNDRPNAIWGPALTSSIVQRRFQGFLWNLHGEMDAAWSVFDVDEEVVREARFELSDAFANRHEGESRPHNGVIHEAKAYTVEAVVMDHKTPSLAYIVRERSRLNVATERMGELGLRPGPWIQQLKSSEPSGGSIAIDDESYSLDDLRRELLVESEGSSIAYLTDFRLDAASKARLSERIRGCDTVVCEAQYSHEDLHLAEKNYHMTVQLAAELAKSAEVQDLILFHLSDRYDRDAWKRMLDDAREVMPKARFPEHWSLGE